MLGKICVINEKPVNKLSWMETPEGIKFKQAIHNINFITDKDLRINMLDALEALMEQQIRNPIVKDEEK